MQKRSKSLSEFVTLQSAMQALQMTTPKEKTELKQQETSIFGAENQLILDEDCNLDVESDEEIKDGKKDAAAIAVGKLGQGMDTRNDTSPIMEEDSQCIDEDL